MQGYKYMQKQQGFTLIELMIVVAIIGILAAIAIPQYQDYVARSQASEAVVLLSAAKTPVEEFVMVNGAFPDGNTGQGLGDLGVRTSGEYVDAITIEAASSSSGKLKAVFSGSGVSGELAGQALVFYRNNSGEWSCYSPSDAIPTSLLPEPCSTEAVATS